MLYSKVFACLAIASSLALTTSALPVASVAQDVNRYLGPEVYAVKFKCEKLFCKDTQVEVASFPALKGGLTPLGNLYKDGPTKPVNSEWHTVYSDVDSKTKTMYVYRRSADTSEAPTLEIFDTASGTYKTVNLTIEMRQIMSITFVDSKLIVTTIYAVGELDTTTGAFTQLMDISSYGNGGYTTTDGKSLIMMLTSSGAEWRIATIDINTGNATFSEPDLMPSAGPDGHQLLGMHWNFELDTLVGIRTSAGMLEGMDVGNISLSDARAFQEVTGFFLGPLYNDFDKAPDGNQQSFTYGNYWYAVVDDKITSVDMISRNSKVVEGPMFDGTFEAMVPLQGSA